MSGRGKSRKSSRRGGALFGLIGDSNPELDTCMKECKTKHPPQPTTSIMDNIPFFSSKPDPKTESPGLLAGAASTLNSMNPFASKQAEPQGLVEKAAQAAGFGNKDVQPAAATAAAAGGGRRRSRRRRYRRNKSRIRKRR